MSEFVLISKDPSNLEEENRIEVLRHKVIDSHDPDDKQEFYKACAKWFQQRHLRAVTELDYSRQHPSTAESDKEAVRNAALEEYMKRLRNGLSGLLEFTRESVDQAITDARLSFRALKSQPSQPSDTEMLDWMIKNNGLVEIRGNQYYCGYGPYGTVLNGALAGSPREAIKAAMRADREDK